MAMSSKLISELFPGEVNSSSPRLAPLSLDKHERREDVPAPHHLPKELPPPKEKGWRSRLDFVIRKGVSISIVFFLPRLPLLPAAWSVDRPALVLSLSSPGQVRE